MTYKFPPEHLSSPTPDAPERFVSTDSGKTYGITIVGEAGSGKSTLAETSLKAWGELFPHTEKFRFDSGIGFRRIAADIAYKTRPQALDTDQIVEGTMFSQQVSCFPEGRLKIEMTQILDRAYITSPLHENRLRTATVTSAVPYVAEDPFFRPHLNEAASRRLKNILHNPSLAGLDERPSLVVLDGRNRYECNKMLSDAGVEPLCTFVLTCVEEVAAARKAARDSSRDLTEEVRRLQERNKTDRRRGLGPLTLPRDIAKPIDIARQLNTPDEHSYLAQIGRTAMLDPENTGIIFRTDKMTLEDEYRVVKGVFAGMFKTRAA